MNTKKGITLIALVVTIIVLLILAAVTITLILGPDGVIEKARDTRVSGRYANIMDKVYARDANLAIAFNLGETGESQEEFINRLIAERLLFEGEYDKETYRNIYLGEKKDGTYKYIINIADGTASGKIIANMINSLPDAEAPGNEYLKRMSLKIKTTVSNEVVELPISNTTGLTINWDVANNPNSFDNPNLTENPTYSYLDPDEYEVQISGISQEGTSFGINMVDYINPNIIGINFWGENGFSAINSMGYYLQDNIPLPSRNSFVNVLNFETAFTDWSKISGEIPALLFANCPKVTSFNRTFANCEKLTTIPGNLFLNCPNVLNFRTVFYGCSNLAQIPTGLFDNCTKVTNFEAIFYDCLNLNNAIPIGFFKNNTKVISFSFAFSGCKKLTAIPAGLFDHCSNAEDFSVVFQSCENISTIPQGLFKYSTEATSFRWTFASCTKLTAIPPGLFDNCPNVTTFNGVFYFCTKLSSPIPAGLFSYCPNVETFEFAFNCCFTLPGEIPSGLFSNCPKVTSFEYTFVACSNLTNIPIDLFDACPNVTTFHKTFNDCKGLEGNAPNLWARTNVIDSEACFQDCINLLNYAEIPDDWK